MYHEKLKILNAIFGRCHKTGKELLYQCPKCEDTSKRKLSVNIEKDAFKCWVCGYSSSSLFRLVRRHGNFSQRQAWELFEENTDLSPDSFYEQMFGAAAQKEEQTIKLPEEFISLANKKLPLASFAPLKYLKKRGITKADIIKWKIGYCPKGEYAGRIIIPSFNNDGKVNYFVARTYKDEWNKYKLPEGLSKDIVFNELYVDWKNDLVIIEGTFDGMKAENSVPILGSTLREDSKLFQEIVKHDTPTYVALDPDAEKKALRLISALLSYGVEVYKINVSGFEDVGAMTKQEFKKRKDNAVLIDSVSCLEYELRGIL